MEFAETGQAFVRLFISNQDDRKEEERRNYGS
jgi:hypothetical protein